MTKVTGEAVYAAANRAGFKGNDAIIAVQVAGAESDWDTEAVNPSSKAAGIMQIHPSHASEFPTLWPKRFELDANMQMAKQVKDRQGWKAWTTYTSGKYKDRVKVGSNPMPAGGGALSFTLDGKTSIASPGAEKVAPNTNLDSPLNAIADQARKIADNLGGLLVGLVLLVLGVVVILRKPLASAAVNATPVGKAAKTIGKVAG